MQIPCFQTLEINIVHPQGSYTDTTNVGPDGFHKVNALMKWFPTMNGSMKRS